MKSFQDTTYNIINHYSFSLFKLRKINRFLKIEDYNNKLEEFSEFDSIKFLPKYDFLKGSTGENKMLEFILDI